MLNARCFRCGWSFTLSREMIAAALTSAAGPGDKYHVEYCPQCRQAIKIPMDQLKRAAPAGWKPSAPPAAPPTPAPSLTPASEPAPAPSAPAAQAEAAPRSAPAEMAKAVKPARKRRAGKSADTKGAAKAKAPVAKKTSPSKPAAKKPAASKKTKSAHLRRNL